MSQPNGKLAGAPALPAQKLRYPKLVTLLIALSAAAFYLTWGAFAVDGTLLRMLRVLGAEKSRIPGSQEPLRLRYTGIAPVDYWLQIMVVFFWQAVDGSHPDTSLTGIYFLGQLIGIWSLLFVEGNRPEHRGLGIAKTLMWALLMQNLTLACFGPIYLAIYLETSPRVVQSVQGKDAESARPKYEMQAAQGYLRFLPYSVLIGYIAPSILIGLPAPTAQSYANQQAAIALWTPFPIWVALAQYIFTQWFDGQSHVLMVHSTSESKLSSQSEAQNAYMRSLRATYLFALIGSSLVHIGVVSISLSTVLFPKIFALGYSDVFAPAALLRPRIFYDVSTIGGGVRRFMQWDQWVGNTALLVWALALLRGDHERSGWGFWAWKILQLVFATVFLGPAAAVILLIWVRDEAEWSNESRAL